MGSSALDTLASQSHQQAEKALAEAAHKINEPINKKVNELNDFRDQVKSQTKSLRQLITSCDNRAAKLSKLSKPEAQYAKARSIQTEIEMLNRQILTVERSEELRKLHATNE